MPLTRILFVDDDVLSHWVMAADLANAGYEVCGQCRGNSAVRFLEKGGDFALLVTDMHQLGGMSGLDLAAIWRRLRPGRPVLFVSASPLRESDAIGPDAGFILKYAAADDLVEMVQRLLADTLMLPARSDLSGPRPLH